VWNIIRSLVADGVTVLLTTQYLEEADALADDISVIDHGKVIAHGTPAELKQVVGGQTILVRPTDPARLADATAILAAVSGREPESPARGVIAVPVDDDTAFTKVVGRLDREGIGVTELSLRLPSLDEVFFTLTGRHTVEETAA
jgi:oleandomycin transport system ATP-binding protein